MTDIVKEELEAPAIRAPKIVDRSTFQAELVVASACS